MFLIFHVLTKLVSFYTQTGKNRLRRRTPDLHWIIVSCIFEPNLNNFWSQNITFLPHPFLRCVRQWQWKHKQRPRVGLHERGANHNTNYQRQWLCRPISVRTWSDNGPETCCLPEPPPPLFRFLSALYVTRQRRFSHPFVRLRSNFGPLWICGALPRFVLGPPDHSHTTSDKTPYLHLKMAQHTPGEASYRLHHLLW